MKQIRKGTFETNSSSIHSITMCSGDEYSKWMNGELLFWEYQNKFGTKEDIIEEIKNMKYHDCRLIYTGNFDDPDYIHNVFSDEKIMTYKEYYDYYEDYFETYEQSYTTPSGDDIVAFGYYGHD